MQQISDEIYNIVYGKDLRPMKDLIYKKFKKRSLFQLSNDQMESIIPEIKKIYGASHGSESSVPGGVN